MNLLDLYEQREPYQQAIDKLEQSRIDTLNDRMQELVARARTADAKTKASLKQQYEKIKNERDSYYKISEAGIPGEKDYAYHRAKERQHELAGDKLMAKAKSFGAYAHPTGIAARKKAEQHYAKADEHRAAWKELGSGPLKEGSMKRWLWSEAERLEKEDFIANADDYGMSEQEAAEFWDSINGALDEAGIPGNVPTEKIPGKEELLKGRGRTYYEADQVNEYFVRSGDDIMSVMSLNLFKDLLGDASLSNYDEEFADSPEWQAVVDKWQPKAEHLQKELAKYQSAGRKLRDAEADAIDATVYDGGDAYEDAETAASYLPKVYAKQASALVRLLKDGYANPPAGMHEDDSRVVSQNPAPAPLTPKQEFKDRALRVRRKKQNLLKRFANGGVIVEIEWALEHNVFMTKEQMLDYLDHTIEDPDLEPIEYMHDKGFTSDSMIKGLFKRLVGLGLSKSQILGIIKNGDQGKPASPSLISRIAGRVLRSEVSENQEFVPAVGDEIMWRPKNAKMVPTPVTVVATTPDQLKIKLQSPRMIQNAGKDTIVVDINNSDIFPKSVSGSAYKAQKKNSEKVNEYLSMGSDKNYQEAEPYKNYKIYVRRKPFGNTGVYTAHTEIDRKEFMGKGSSQEEAIAAVRDRIDFVLNAQRKVTGSSTIDFNVKFATDLLADPRQTFYAKLEKINGEPKLIIAGADIASDPELLAAGDFKRSAVRNQVDDEGRATPLPGIPLTAKGLRSGDWIANGRYTIGKETTDRDGNRVFDLTYHSTAHTKSDKLRLNQPAFTLGTAREVDEHGGGIGPKQRWQDLMPEGWSDKYNLTPYAVYIDGRQWKVFSSDEHARAVAEKVRANLKRQGRDQTVTIAPSEEYLQSKIKEEELVEGIKDTATATAVVACLLAGGSLSGCATAPQQTTAQQVLKTGQDVGRTVQAAKRITRAGAEEEVRQELRNLARGMGGHPGELNNSNILRIWKRIKGAPPVQPEPEAPENYPAPPRQRMPQSEQIVKETNQSQPAEEAILKRIFVAHRDLLVKYGPEKVMQAAEDVAYNVGDQEIGSSDVSGWVRQVEQILGARP